MLTDFHLCPRKKIIITSQANVTHCYVETAQQSGTFQLTAHLYIYIQYIYIYIYTVYMKIGTEALCVVFVSLSEANHYMNM